MIQVKGFAAKASKAPLEPFSFQRRDLREKDIQIEILFCGVCHSDIHQVRDEWGGSIFPMVPGHEIVGKVIRTGDATSRFKVGDIAGVGCFVDSCRNCTYCDQGVEQFCEGPAVMTYNSKERDGKTLTYGGYSAQIVVDENYALKVSPKLPLDRVAPLLCAGITTYSPMMHWKMGKGHRLGVLGLGGLGHMAVKLGASLGAEVTVLSSSKNKEADARKLGAHEFALTSDTSAKSALRNRFDFIINTVSAPHNLNTYLEFLKADGTMVLLGVPPEAPKIEPFLLIGRRRKIGGSLIGGIKETQQMLDYCAQNNVLSDVEVIPMKEINTAYERMLRGDVRYRFVIDMKTL